MRFTHIVMFVAVSEKEDEDAEDMVEEVEDGADAELNERYLASHFL